MIKVTITYIDQLEVHLPDDYEQVELPGLDKWVIGLSNHPQGKGFLYNDNGYCCLGVLCKTQNRLTKVGNLFTDGGTSSYWLSSHNPLFNTLSKNGRFPPKVKVVHDGIDALSLSVLNDIGIPFSTIIKLLKLLYKEPANAGICP